MARIVDIPRFNTVLDDKAREHYLPATKTLWALAPDMMKRKIAEANVQQSFVLAGRNENHTKGQRMERVERLQDASARSDVESCAQDAPMKPKR